MRSTPLLLIFFAVLMLRSVAQPFEFDLQGHRGCRAWYPENTLAGFLLAIDQGVTTLEMDVVISGDEQVVVSHEAWMSSEICSTPDGQPVDVVHEREYNLFRMPYGEILRWDCGRRGHPRFPGQQAAAATKPLLRDVFSACEAYARAHDKLPIRYNIEIKSEPGSDGVLHPAPTRFAELVLACIPASIPPTRVTLQSFDLRPLQWLRTHSGGHPLSLLVDEQQDPEACLLALGFIPDVLSPYYGLVSVELLTYAHARGMRVIPWTVNDPETARQLVGWGVDGFITDDPVRVGAVCPKNKRN